MSVAVIQMVSQPEIAANLTNAEHWLRQAAEAGARLAVLPENFAAMGRGDSAQIAWAEARGEGPILPWLRRISRELKLWIVAGTIPLPPAAEPTAKPMACSLVFNDQGEQVARYDKLHLFEAQVADARGLYRESDDYDFGQQWVVVDTPVGRLGLSVCYDLRFAELYSCLREAGAELISAPSAFTAVTGAAHWECLIRTRAIETQCYVLAAGQGGLHAGGRETWGHSAIVDPWGRIVAEQAQGPGFILAEPDRAQQQAIRQRMPITEHRRFSVASLKGRPTRSDYE